MNNPMLRIDELALSLPSGFESRAASIARRVVEQLAHLPCERSMTIPRLVVPTVRVRSTDTDTMISQRIARSIVVAVQRTTHALVDTAERVGPSPDNKKG